MVILTVVTTENPHTVYFDQPIKKPSYIRLLSCSLYNSWNSLEKDGIIFYKKGNAQDEETHYLRMGNYSLDDIGDIFQKGFPDKDFFTVEKGITGRSLIIKANKDKIGKFRLNESLPNPLAPVPPITTRAKTTPEMPALPVTARKKHMVTNALSVPPWRLFGSPIVLLIIRANKPSESVFCAYF